MTETTNKSINQSINQPTNPATVIDSWPKKLWSEERGTFNILRYYVPPGNNVAAQNLLTIHIVVTSQFHLWSPFSKMRNLAQDSWLIFHGFQCSVNQSRTDFRAPKPGVEWHDWHLGHVVREPHKAIHTKVCLQPLKMPLCKTKHLFSSAYLFRMNAAVRSTRGTCSISVILNRFAHTLDVLAELLFWTVRLRAGWWRRAATRRAGFCIGIRRLKLLLYHVLWLLLLFRKCRRLCPGTSCGWCNHI